MRSRLLITAAIAVLAATISSSAFADYELTEKSRVGLSLAFMRPSGSEMKNMASTWLGPTLTGNLTFDEYDRPTTMVSLSWFAQEGAAQRMNMIPLTATYIKRFGTDDENPWYVGGGAGLYFTSYKHYAPYYVSDSATKFGVNMVAGKEMGGWYIEFRYDAVSKMDVTGGGNIDLSGFSLSIGSRLAL